MSFFLLIFVCFTAAYPADELFRFTRAYPPDERLVFCFTAAYPADELIALYEGLSSRCTASFRCSPLPVHQCYFVVNFVVSCYLVVSSIELYITPHGVEGLGTGYLFYNVGVWLQH